MKSQISFCFSEFARISVKVLLYADIDEVTSDSKYMYLLTNIITSHNKNGGKII